MIIDIVFVVLALLGVGFLIFIHELGHLFMARRTGMKVEVFSIGFGKPIYSWQRKGVRWQIGILPFGGYVKIAGMHQEGTTDPYTIPNGFFGKKPWQRIQVAFMGPFANLLFGIAALSFLWFLGGRERPFSEYTHYVGWVDPSSEWYHLGVRPGDEITEYNGHPFSSFLDLYKASILDGALHVKGYRIDPLTGEKAPFAIEIPPSKEFADSFSLEVFPAQYLTYAPTPPELGKMPIQGSGIQPGDRLFWANGERLFSRQQLNRVTNDPFALLSVEREGKVFLAKAPRIQVQELRMSLSQKAEIDDWQHEAGIKERTKTLYFLPYNLTSSCEVEELVPFIDSALEKKIASVEDHKSLYLPLKRGDKIIAVNGRKVGSSFELLRELQKKQVLLMVVRGESNQALSWKNADQSLEKEVHLEDFRRLEESVASAKPLVSEGNLFLLAPIVPQGEREIFSGFTKRLEAIEVPRQLESLRSLQTNKELFLGMTFQREREVRYNPNPLVVFSEISTEMGKTFWRLVTGHLNPKKLSGPIGIVHMVQFSWLTGGVKEALFWLAFISVNLGFLNLLPIPVLDGGYIVLSVVEWIRRKPMKIQTFERLIFPFLILLLLGFIYITYNDILNLVGRFFHR